MGELGNMIIGIQIILLGIAALIVVVGWILLTELAAIRQAIRDQTASQWTGRVEIIPGAASRDQQS